MVNLQSLIMEHLITSLTIGLLSSQPVVVEKLGCVCLGKGWGRRILYPWHGLLYNVMKLC
jgi:hypothetical protein